jgi:DNA-binding NtrC family response regulator
VELLKETLEQDGFRVCHVGSASIETFLASCPEPPDVLVCDMNLPDGSGTGLCREVLRQFPKCKAILMSGDPDSLPGDFAFKVLSKPFALSEFLDLVCELTNHHRTGQTA